MKWSSLFYTVFLMLFAVVPLCATTRGARPGKSLDPKTQRVRNNLLLIAMSARGVTVKDVECLIGKGAEINCTDSEGNTPLQLAEKNNRSDFVKILVDHGAKSSLKSKNEAIVSEKHSNPTPEIVPVVKITEPVVATPSVNISIDVVRTGNIAEIEALLNKGADVNLPLCEAVKQGKVKVAQLLLQRGAKVDVEVEREWTLLCQAVFDGGVAMAQLLLEYGADVNVVFLQNLLTDKTQFFPIKISNNHSVVARQLVEAFAGARRLPRKELEVLFSPANSAVSGFVVPRSPEEQTRLNEQLVEACCVGNLVTVENLLARGVSANAQDKGEWGALERAVQGGHTHIAQLLLDKGADPNRPDSHCSGYKFTPLYDAAAHGTVAMVRSLINAGAHVNTVFTTNTGMKTALFEAVLRHNPEMVRLFIDAGADVNAPARYHSLLHYVLFHNLAQNGGDWCIKEKERIAIAKQLIAGGANMDIVDDYNHTVFDVAQQISQNGMARLFARINNFFADPAGMIHTFKNLEPKDDKREWFEMLVAQSIVRNKEDLVPMLLAAAPEFESHLTQYVFAFKFFANPEQEIEKIKSTDLRTIKMLIEKSALRNREDLVDKLVQKAEGFESYMKHYAYLLVARKYGNHDFKNRMVTLGGLCDAKIGAALKN
jgi:ankyrin repeat protein